MIRRILNFLLRKVDHIRKKFLLILINIKLKNQSHNYFRVYDGCNELCLPNYLRHHMQYDILGINAPYFLPRGIDFKDRKVITIGLSDDISFEIELINKGALVYSFDPSEIAKNHVETLKFNAQNNLKTYVAKKRFDNCYYELKSQQDAMRLHFFPHGLSSKTQNQEIWLSDKGTFSTIKGNHYSTKGKIQLLNWEDLLKMAGLSEEDNILLIKMDIEGGEYEAIPPILSSKMNVYIFCIELHFFNQRIKNILSLIDLFKMHGYILYFQDGVECTFIRKDFLRGMISKAYSKYQPVALNQ